MDEVGPGLGRGPQLDQSVTERVRPIVGILGDGPQVAHCLEEPERLILGLPAMAGELGNAEPSGVGASLQKREQQLERAGDTGDPIRILGRCGCNVFRYREHYDLRQPDSTLPWNGAVRQRVVLRRYNDRFTCQNENRKSSTYCG